MMDVQKMTSIEVEAANDAVFQHQEEHDQQNRIYSLLAEITDSYLNQPPFYRLDNHLEKAINEFCRLADSANNVPSGMFENIILRRFGDRSEMDYDTRIEIIAYLNKYVRLSE